MRKFTLIACLLVIAGCDDIAKEIAAEQARAEAQKQAEIQRRANMTPAQREQRVKALEEFVGALSQPVQRAPVECRYSRDVMGRIVQQCY